MDKPRRCPQCGAELATDAPGGLCPECLLKEGMCEPDEGTGTESTSQPDPHEAATLPPNSEIQGADAFKSPSRYFLPELSELSKCFPQLEILEQIGQGGMGAVYKARQPNLDREVALKILLPALGKDPSFAERFSREARALAKLNHPNIVSVYDFGQAGELYYFLMEFVDGANLRNMLRGGQLNPSMALSIIPEICEALQYAHDEGIVHRDIKPENILLDKKGRVRIADFGLVKLRNHESPEMHLTYSGQVMGTTHYMAPEQMETPLEVDHRADIYSLGVTFYEMLTGQLPIGNFEPPSKKVHVDFRLDEVVLRSLAREPERRYQHASEVKTDVESISQSGAVVRDTDIQSEAGANASLQEQELAGRMLLTRRELMERVEKSLRPLFRLQIVQMLVGVALIVLGAQCWAQNTHVPHRVVCGVIVHVYGVVVIVAAGTVCTRIKRIDYSKPVDDIRTRLDTVRSVYLRVGHVIGFPWWLMWIPVCVAFGFDAVLHPNSLNISLIVGVVGLVVTGTLCARLLNSGKESAEAWRRQFSGKSIAAAYLALGEIENAQIR